MANPKVEIRPTGEPGPWPGSKQHVIWCLTGDCTYAGSAQTKTDAQVIQRNHVRRHRTRQAERRALNQEPRDV